MHTYPSLALAWVAVPGNFTLFALPHDDPPKNGGSHA